jgi:hypothetical protein
MFNTCNISESDPFPWSDVRRERILFSWPSITGLIPATHLNRILFHLTSDDRTNYTPVLLNILLAEEVGQCPLASSRQDLDLTILNSFIVSCDNVTSLRIMMEHVARNRTPALSSTIYHLEEASGHWIISSANRMLSHVCGVVCSKEASEPVSQRHIA